MRLKTLGVLLVTALAVFTMLYWMTDDSRRERSRRHQEEELLALRRDHLQRRPDGAGRRGLRPLPRRRRRGRRHPERPRRPPAPSLHTASLANKLRVNPNYVHLAVSYGGVVVSGNVNSPMPAWSYEVGGPLNEQQVEAVVTLVESGQRRRATGPGRSVPDTRRGGRRGVRLGRLRRRATAPISRAASGRTSTTIGSALITDLPTVQPAAWIRCMPTTTRIRASSSELWIRDSADELQRRRGDRHAAASRRTR